MLKIYTYKDYLYYKKILENTYNTNILNEISASFYKRIVLGIEREKIENVSIMLLKEESSEYTIEKSNNLKCKARVKNSDSRKTEKISQPHDKIFKIILSNKNEVARLINKQLELKEEKYKIKAENLEKYNCKFITGELKNRESDIVYKLKRRNIFFLIEIQSKIDYRMPYRITEYMMLILNETMDKTKSKRKNYKYPLICPIVLYTGEQEWKDIKLLEDVQEKLEGLKRRTFTEYNLIDMSKFTKEELLENEGLLSKMVLLEKSKTEKEIAENLEKILSQKMSEEEKELLKRIISKIFLKNINRKTAEKIMKKLNSREEKGMALEEVLRKSREREFKRGISEGEKLGIKKGRKEEKNKIIMEMIRNQVGDSVIMKIVDINEAELEKIKKNFITNK